MITRIRRPGQPPADIDHGPGVARPEGIRRMTGSVPALALTEAVQSGAGVLWDNGVRARAAARRGDVLPAAPTAGAAYRRAYRARVGR